MVHYKCTTFYDRDDEVGIAYDDPALAIRGRSLSRCCRRRTNATCGGPISSHWSRVSYGFSQPCSKFSSQFCAHGRPK